MPAYSGSPIPNIPPRHGSPHDEILRSPVMFPRSLTQDSRAAHNSGGGGGGGGSEVPTPVNLAELDSLPLSDEQKARIIERHLARAEGGEDEPGVDAAGGAARRSRDGSRSRSRPTSHADSDASHSPSLSAADDDNNIEEMATPSDDGYQGPHTMQGGAITDDVYRWAHHNRRRVPKRARSESLHLPRTSTIDPDLDASAIREPGGFRRYFVLAQAADQGRPAPRAVRSFIDFLSLYGHFAGEDLSDIEDEDEDEEDEDDDDEEAGLGMAGASRGSTTRQATESTPLVGSRRRKGLSRSGSRLRRGSAGEGGERQRGEATVTDAVMMLLKSFVGTGILFLGKAFYNGGLLFSTGVLCAVAMISLASFLTLVKTNLAVPASFGEMGGILYGPKMRLAILASIVFSQLGFVAAYTVFVAQNLQAFVLAVTHCRTLIPTVWLIVAQMLLFLPLSLVRRIAKLSSTALIADLFILLGIIYLFSFEIRQVAQHGLADVVYFNSKSFPLFIGTAVFTFEGIGLIIPITESMREPERFPKALSGVMAGVMVLFATSGALSYAAFGSHVQTVVITNLPQDAKFVQALQFLYSLAILLSTPLQLFPAVTILERGLMGTKSGKHDWRVKLHKNLFRCSIVAVSCLGAWLGSASLDVFVSFIGSVACVPLCFIYPPLLHLKACATRRRTIILDYCLLAFGIVTVVFAGSQTVRELLSPGSPPDQPVCRPPE
ncbi:hypothetical protein FA10DRAFT_234050 [Acaromyces ingoldii]|uniref:Amino acid transporter transmembrane domain-containing protein n=1 Tax=Acaromyces ingoldii TaxID=215250 RepID=A0A316YEA9_9BASI|nr:hypothetical protein FA10DRAFT_234050 [Acaromyces ingoldii]PWN87910.1 hypothetical protein FA10DRAFT_234050 [Acaromyces ingoldii]